MDDWRTVRWTEAAQIAAFLELEDGKGPPESVTPAAWFANLRATGRTDDALAFLGMALPRLESIHWAGALLAEEACARTLPSADRQALDQSLRWLDAPSDAHRRAAWRAGQAAGLRAPERVLTHAVFFSGGSISEPQAPPVLPAPELTGQCAGGAVRMAAARPGAGDAFRARALDLGVAVARRGLEALPR